MTGMTWGRMALMLVAALGALVATALWLEHQEASDPSGSAYAWGSGPGRTAPPPTMAAASQDDMVLVAGGTYWIGDNSAHPAADAPPRRVRIDAFYIDRHEVTNREFARFVEVTGHRTSAEREGGAWVYRGGERDWTYVRGADWRHPLGPGSSIDKAMDHPAVLVSWHDAAAYAKWAGKRLPTEAEWEVAARGGKSATFPDHLVVHFAADKHDHTPGAADRPAGEPPHPAAGGHGGTTSEGPNPAADGSANVWQGRWPQRNSVTDGYFYTAPVGSFAPNELGIDDMIGNVWEWTADWYAPDTYRAQGTAEKPAGPYAGTLRVARGGSWFCSANYCGAYRPGFRGKSPPTSAFNNVGFRCARDVASAAG